MAFLLHLDNQSQFSVYIDGTVQARIQKTGDAWLLHPLNDPKKVVDVSALIYQHDALKPVVIQSLK